MEQKYQIGTNPDWKIKQLSRKEIRKVSIICFLFCMFWILLGLKVFITFPDIFSCNKDKKICSFETRRFWETSYKTTKTFEMDKNITVEFKSQTKRGGFCSRIFIQGIPLNPFYMYRGYCPREHINKIQFKLIQNFFRSSDNELIIKEDIDKTLWGSMWIIAGLLCAYISRKVIARIPRVGH